MALNVMNYRSYKLWRTVSEGSQSENLQITFELWLKTLKFSLCLCFYEAIDTLQFRVSCMYIQVLLYWYTYVRIQFQRQLASLHSYQMATGIHAADSDCLTSWCQNVSINNFNFMLQWWSYMARQLIYQVLSGCMYSSKWVYAFFWLKLRNASHYNKLILSIFTIHKIPLAAACTYGWPSDL